MNIAFVYENVLPERGGCETYIADLARRLVVDRHETHLYARRALRALEGHTHDVTIGFDKTFGQDILYPLGGLHSASSEQNVRKHAGKAARFFTRLLKAVDPAHWSFKRLERTQYLGSYNSA